MKKYLGMALVVALVLLTGLNSARAFAQTALTCATVETVAAGDTLSKYAAAAYGDAKMYMPIVDATNAQSATDKSFHFIDNPDKIEIGWKVCVPAKDAASAGSAAQATELTGTVWKWTGSQFNDGKTTTPDDPNKYLLSFLADGSVAIQADCNRVGGTYTTDAGQLTITLGPTTLVACPAGSLEQEYLRQLGIVSSYFIKDGNLILEFKFDSGSMTFAPSAPAGLSGTRWNVINYNNGKQAVVGLIDGSEISLNFGDGRVSGSAGCNNYTGGYEASGNTLKVGGLATTFKLCHKPDGIMEQEQKYLTALQSAATYEIAGDMLTIRDGSGAMQVVAKANLPAGLGGTQWQVTGYNNGKQALVSLLNDTAITLNFGKDKRVSGNASCNNYTGGFESGDGTLKVGALAATQKMCVAPEGIMEQEQQYLAALQNAATFELNGSALTIRDADGAMQVTATAYTAPALAGSAWEVTNYNNGKQAVVTLVADSKITLAFGTDGIVSGNSGCNTYSGDYETSGDTLKVGPLASTRMFCEAPAGAMDQETQYLTALQNAATYEISGNTLTIRDAEGAMQVVATR